MSEHIIETVTFRLTDGVSQDYLATLRFNEDEAR
jgi:hypothetical protein